MRAEPWDTVIVGGGPAGLSAALVLGRCCRRVLVCDDGQPRNRASKALHGFLTRDGIAPSEFLQLARQQLQRYENVQLLDSSDGYHSAIEELYLESFLATIAPSLLAKF